MLFHPKIVTDIKLFLRNWLAKFGPGEWPQSRKSLIQHYSAGHLKPAWEVRLAAKSVFAQIWGTDKLLTSMDAIAIGRPPEDGQEPFWSPDSGWLHVDQKADRVGLHGVQGAVYLEDAGEDDWTLEVIAGSHRVFDEFMDVTNQYKCRNVRPEDIAWMEARGCKRQRVPCPKGGLLLWESRLFHANAQPLQDRTNPGRWRFVVFVCMTPASWAGDVDIEAKRAAYTDMRVTHHWPSQGIVKFIPELEPGSPRLTEEPRLPDEALTDEAKRLVGVLPYEDDSLEDRKSRQDSGAKVGVQIADLDFRPKWNREKFAEQHKI